MATLVNTHVQHCPIPQCVAQFIVLLLGHKHPNRATANSGRQQCHLLTPKSDINFDTLQILSDILLLSYADSDA